MDLSSKEFTLNFRGFEQDDPETVQRFTAFCEANFTLSPDTFGDARDRPDAVVLTHGDSPEALEALAMVLREIGARVDVSNDCKIEEGTALVGLSSQELYRLFGHAQEEFSTGGNGLACPYPPLGRTLYLLNRSDGVFDRRHIRAKNYRPNVTQKTLPQAPRKHQTLVAISVIVIALGMLVLITAALLVTRTQLLFDKQGERSLFWPRDHAEKTRSEAHQGAKSLSAHVRVGGFNVDLKVLASSRSLSISALTLTPDADSPMSDGSRIKRVVGDPTFLTESSSGEWSGRVQLSVFVDTNGEESYLTIPAKISVRMSTDSSVGRARIAVANDAMKGSSSEAPPSHVVDSLTTFAVSELAVS
jgi:hypothetical protein